MTIAAIYARVSTDEQARAGYSLQDQIASCRQRLIAQGYTDIAEYIDDGYSGEFLDRPGLDNLREDLRAKKISIVMVYDPDRLSRNLTNQLLLADELEKAECKLLFVTGDYDASPEGRLFFSIRGAIAEFEKAKIRERTIRGRRRKALQGKIPINTKPFGFAWDKENSTYIINEEEAKVVRLMYRLCINDFMGTPQIAGYLNDKGVTNRGKPWNYMAIYRILTKELYCGTAYAQQIRSTKIGQNAVKVTNRDKEDWIAIPIPPIVSREEWEKAVETVKGNYTSKRNAKREYLLTSIIKCAVCGRGMVASHLKNGRRDSYYYRCVTGSSPLYRDNRTCANGFINVDELEEDVWSGFCQLLAKPKRFRQIMQGTVQQDNSKEIAEVEKLLITAKRTQADITKWYRAQIIDPETAERDLLEIAKDIKRHTSKLTELKKVQPIKLDIPEPNREEILSLSTIAEKRKALLKYRIIVRAKKTGRRSFEWEFERL